MIAYDRLSKIIPPDQALANKALQVSLQQIKGVATMSQPGLASAFEFTSTTNDLNLLNELTQPIPDSVMDFYANNYASGTGENGTLYITDLIGAAAGEDYTTPINNCVTTINSLTTNGTLSTLITIYTRMQNTVNGVYGNAVTGPVIIPAGPAQGTYADAETAFTSALIANAQTEINVVISANSVATTSLNTEFNNMAANLLVEYNNLRSANIDLANIAGNNRTSVNTFVTQLPDYGVDISLNGPNWYLEQVADMTTLGGQAIIGCLRQGRNSAVFQTTGVISDGEIPPVPAPQANGSFGS